MKLRAKLMSSRPEIDWPAASTIGDILKREGLIEAKPRRCRPVAQGEVVSGAAANGEWAIDFKGWFRKRDGERCDPLTVTDTASRYLIETRIVDPTWIGVRAALERVFSDVGLPDAIRSDNGAPFGSTRACCRACRCGGCVLALHRAIFLRPLRKTTPATCACIAP